MASAFPNVAAQWHPTLNGAQTAHHVTPKATVKVWWLCPAGHDYRAYVGHRTAVGTGCPVCSNRQVLAGYNDMANTHSQLAAEWHPTANGELTPQQVIAGTNRKFWWLCDAGHSWQALSSHRTKGVGCPICSNRQILAGFNDLATTHPTVAAEWHSSRNGDLQPTQVSAGSDTVVWWRCAAGHEYRSPCSRRTGPRPGGCRFCSGREAVAGETDLATSHPRVAALWHPTLNHPLTASRVTLGTGREVWWQCPAGHQWRQRITTRVRADKTGRGCPGCQPGGSTLLAGVNDLSTTHPQLGEQWHPTANGELKPHHVKAGTDLRIWWLCAAGHTWQAVCSSRSGGLGCPVCSNKQVLAGFNDLGTTHRDVAVQWHPRRNGDLTPTDLLPGSNRRVWWRCEHGHDWQAVCSSRTHGGRGCPVCSGHVAVSGLNDLATLFPELAFEWHPTLNAPLTPETVRPGSGHLIWWCCRRGHTWRAACASRTGPLRTGCPVCKNKKTVAGVNDLATTHPKLAVEWHPYRNGILTPSDVNAGAPRKVWWRCTAGHEWAAVLGNRSRLGVGCADCNTAGGFRPNSPAVVYLVTDGQAYKIGIAGATTGRLGMHERLGWSTLRTWRFEVGWHAQAVEQQVLRHVRQVLLLPPFYGPEDMPQNGWSETVSADAVSLVELAGLVEEMAAGVAAAETTRVQAGRTH